MPSPFADFLQTDVVTGRALLHVGDRPIAYRLPCPVEDIKAMGRFRQRLVGSVTQGMTWVDGIYLSPRWVAEFRATRPIKLEHLVLHECAHWWQLWKRMGALDFPLTYGWQGLLALWKYGSAHLYAQHPMEREAHSIEISLIYAARNAYLEARSPSGFVFDTGEWLDNVFPAER